MNFPTAALFRKYQVRLVAVSFLAAALVANFFLAPTKAEAATQAVSYYVNGDCSDYYDEEGEYAIFEEEEDWTCYITVKVKPLAPKRKVTLQYWDKKWKVEDTLTTSTKGSANLYFDNYDNDDNFYDGKWKYRVLVAAGGGQKATNSTSFEVSFYAMSVEDYNEDYEYE